MLKSSVPVLVMLVVSALGAAALVWKRPVQHMEGSGAKENNATSQSSTSSATPAPVAQQTPASPSSETTGQDCWVDTTLSSGSTAEDRQEHGRKLAAEFGLLNLMVKVAGDDSQYLLIGGTPDQHSQLVRTANKLKASNPFTTTLCAKGFSKVEFIIINENLEQTDVDTFYTDVKRSGHYLYKLRNARSSR